MIEGENAGGRFLPDRGTPTSGMPRRNRGTDITDSAELALLPMAQPVNTQMCSASVSSVGRSWAVVLIPRLRHVHHLQRAPILRRRQARPLRTIYCLHVHEQLPGRLGQTFFGRKSLKFCLNHVKLQNSSNCNPDRSDWVPAGRFVVEMTI